MITGIRRYGCLVDLLPPAGISCRRFFCYIKISLQLYRIDRIVGIHERRVFRFFYHEIKLCDGGLIQHMQHFKKYKAKDRNNNDHKAFVTLRNFEKDISDECLLFC